MIALLRFLYDIPYTGDAPKQWAQTLKPHAEVYLVADKYCIEALKSEVHKNMQDIIKSNNYLMTVKTHVGVLLDRLKNTEDFVDALQIIYTGTTTEDIQARKLMINFLIQNIDQLRKENELLSLLKECSDLRAEIIGHPDLECEPDGFWYCVSFQCGECVPRCGKCMVEYDVPFLARFRYEELWQCPCCKVVERVLCKNCQTRIWWQPRLAPHLLEPKE